MRPFFDAHQPGIYPSRSRGRWKYGHLSHVLLALFTASTGPRRASVLILDRLPEGVQLAESLGPAEWLRDELRWDVLDMPRRVRDVLPPTFDEYIRVLHPVVDISGGTARHLRWSDVALSHRGEAIGAETSFLELSHSTPSEAFHPLAPQPLDSLPPHLHSHLTEVLSDAINRQEDCWLLYWDGYGWYGGDVRHGWSSEDDAATIARRRDEAERRAHEEQTQLERIPRVILARHEYFLFRGSIPGVQGLVEVLHQSPNVWWPANHGWCIATPVHSFSTYISASKELADAILRRNELEIVRVSPQSLLDRGPFTNE
jgi:hypothetical protein